MLTYHPIELKYIKNNGLWVLDIENISLPFAVKEKSVVCLPAGQIGGNHFHPRKEAFIALNEDLVLIWQDKQGQKHQEKMKPDKQFYLFVLNKNVPHVIKNISTTHDAFLIEYANQLQKNVSQVDLID